MNELLSRLASFALTYLLHSTLLLSACWLAFKLIGERSHFLSERLWKYAAVLGIMTAGMQLIVAPIPLDFASSGGVVAREEASEPSTVDGDQFSSDRLEPSELATAPTIPPTAIAPQVDELLTADSPSSPWLGRNVDSPPLPSASDEAAGQSSTTILAASEEVTPDSAIDSPVTEVEATSAEHASLLPEMAPSERLRGEESQIDNSSSGDNGKPRVWMQRMVAPLACMLAAAVACGLLTLAWQTARLTRCFSSGRVLTSGPARRSLDRFLRRNQITRRIRLLESATYREPVTFGLFRWTIVIPQGAEERLARDELKALFAHEVAHLVRGDMWWLWIGRVLCTCLAFQPLNFLARRRWQQAAEYLCDDWAVERGIGSISLARCLTQIAEWRIGVSSCEIGLAAAGTKATLVQRVERLVEEDRQSDAWAQPLRRRLLVCGVALIAIALAGFAPRVSFPSLPLEIATAESQSSPQVDAPLTRSDWELLEEQLLQLDADLEQLRRLQNAANSEHLTESLNESLHESLTELNRRAGELRARREYIASLIEKDSQR